MKIIADGKELEFGDYEEAIDYLKKESESKQRQDEDSIVNDYINQYMNAVQVVSSETGKTSLLLFSAPAEEAKNYARAVIDEKFGSQYVIINGKLKERYTTGNLIKGARIERATKEFVANLLKRGLCNSFGNYYTTSHATIGETSYNHVRFYNFGPELKLKGLENENKLRTDFNPLAQDFLDFFPEYLFGDM